MNQGNVVPISGAVPSVPQAKVYTGTAEEICALGARPDWFPCSPKRLSFLPNNGEARCELGRVYSLRRVGGGRYEMEVVPDDDGRGLVRYIVYLLRSMYASARQRLVDEIKRSAPALAAAIVDEFPDAEPAASANVVSFPIRRRLKQVRQELARAREAEEKNERARVFAIQVQNLCFPPTPDDPRSAFVLVIDKDTMQWTYSSHANDKDLMERLSDCIRGGVKDDQPPAAA